MIVTLILLGQVLELRARSQTGAAVKKLLGFAAKTARRINADGNEEEVSLESVHIGDRLRVRPGEKVPVDGEMLEGQSAVDEPESRRCPRRSPLPTEGKLPSGSSGPMP